MDMEYRRLGNTGLKLSVLSFGSWVTSWRVTARRNGSVTQKNGNPPPPRMGPPGPRRKEVVWTAEPGSNRLQGKFVVQGGPPTESQGKSAC